MLGRRDILAAASLAGLAATSTNAHAARRRRIATEEGFTIPEVRDAVTRYLATHNDEPGYALMVPYNPNVPVTDLGPRLANLGELRLKHMDEAGIDAALLLSVNGVQLLEAAQATELARLVNERAAEACRKYPGRFYAMTTVAPQNPQAAAQELERGVTALGLKGCVINSHTKGEYLDQPKFRPILEAAAAHDAPLYVHPREPAPAMVKPFEEYGLFPAIWGFAAEAGLHGLRLIMSGVFDELPKLRIVLGHLGEGLPYFLDRLDTRYSIEALPGRRKLKRLPSEYFKDHFTVTTSGMNWPPSVRFCQEVLGADKVMFAADYPFEDPKHAVDQAESGRFKKPDLFWHGNAERVFGIEPAPALQKQK